MKIEKDGIIKELEDEFMLSDYLQAGWKLMSERPSRFMKSVIKTEKDNK
jgi:hypothetical protein